MNAVQITGRLIADPTIKQSKVVAEKRARFTIASRSPSPAYELGGNKTRGHIEVRVYGTLVDLVALLHENHIVCVHGTLHSAESVEEDDPSSPPGLILIGQEIFRKLIRTSQRVSLEQPA